MTVLTVAGSSTSKAPMNDPFALSSRRAWPTTFYFRAWREHSRFAPEIIDFLLQLRAGQSTNLASGIATTSKSAHGLAEGDFDLFQRRHEGLDALKSFIDETLRQAVSHVNGSTTPPSEIQVEFAYNWYHVTNDGGNHDAHDHRSCSWCGIDYLRSGDASSTIELGAGSGVNRLYSPIAIGGGYGDFGASYLSSNRIDITPTDGLLFIFPSYLLHSALAYRGTIDRVIVSFNARLTTRSSAGHEYPSGRG